MKTQDVKSFTLKREVQYVVNKGGRPPKYPLRMMKVGESFEALADIRNVRYALTNYARRVNAKSKFKAVDCGHRWRDSASGQGIVPVSLITRVK